METGGAQPAGGKRCRLKKKVAGWNPSPTQLGLRLGFGGVVPESISGMCGRESCVTGPELLPGGARPHLDLVRVGAAGEDDGDERWGAVSGQLGGALLRGSPPGRGDHNGGGSTFVPPGGCVGLPSRTETPSVHTESPQNTTSFSH